MATKKSGSKKSGKSGGNKGGNKRVFKPKMAITAHLKIGQRK
jgi:hypothetical protein